MNERIKELADQAGVRSIYYNEADNIQKLAELIIKECANVVNSHDDSCTNYWGNYIKEHFGVAE